MAHRKHRRSHGRVYRIHNPDWKILAFAGAAGIVGVIGSNYLVAKVPTFQKYWYAAPVLFVGAGALLLSKMPTIAIALASLGAAFGYVGYQSQQASAGGGSSAGFGEAGRMRGLRADSGYFENAGAFIGPNSRAHLRNQDAGAVIGPAKALMRAQRGAAGNYQDAGALASYATLGRD